MAQPAAVKIAKTGVIPGVLLAVCSLAAFSFFAIPAFIIRPFRYQSAKGLGLAMTVRQAAPLGSLLAALAALLLTLWLWPQAKRMRRVVIVLALLLAGASAVMSRIDYFEWMFHPIPAAGFESAGGSKLDGAEMVMAVKLGAEARAYPIREMAYHHVLNDMVGGVPIVVTY
jgi:hypothetical protein